MANLITSVGYTVGKLHSGLIAYLCHLWNDGDRTPFEGFCQGLKRDVRPKGKLLPWAEWNRIDLVIFDTCDNTALVAFEMKVDDHEHLTRLTKRGKPDWQTVLYSQRLPKCPHLLFVTLGMGDFFRPPQGNRFHWVRLDAFHCALQMIQSDNRVIADWKAAVASELELRQRVLANDSTPTYTYRPGVWNLTLLDNLRERLRRTPAGSAICEGALIYLWGQAPDTILNFGYREREPLYMEINHRGTLNLKANLARLPSPATPEEYVTKAVAFWREQFHKNEHNLHPGPQRRGGETRTLLSFDIGLCWPEKSDNRGFHYEKDVEDTVRRTAAVLEVFFKGVKAEPNA